MQSQVQELLEGRGYGRVQTNVRAAEIYYKYIEGTYQVVLAIGEDEEQELTVPKLQHIIERTAMLFYHPKGQLPEAQAERPVCNVNILTFLYGWNVDRMHILCANVDNVWAYDRGSGHLIIYENQPGDYDGLREFLEELPGSSPAEQEREPQPLYESGAPYEPWSKRQKPTMNERLLQMKGTWKKCGVTVTLVLLNVLIYIVLEIIGSTDNTAFMLAHGALYPDSVFVKGEYWRLLTSMFLHFGLLHLLNNMVILSCAGSQLEESIGHMKFLFLYLLSGVGGSMLSLYEMLHTQSYAVAAGASGAIFGTIGGLLWVVLRHRGRDKTVSVKGLVFMIALCLYYGVSTAGVDNWAHVGGLVTGFVLGMLLTVDFHR